MSAAATMYVEELYYSWHLQIFNSKKLPTKNDI